MNTEDFGHLDLSHAAFLKDCVDLQGKLRLEKLLFRIRQAKVCKDVSAALGYARNAVASFLCFGFHINSAFLDDHAQLPPDVVLFVRSP